MSLKGATTSKMGIINEELETLINNSNPPHSKDMLYNWVVTNRNALLGILNKYDNLELIYWDQENEPKWRLGDKPKAFK